VPIAPRGAPPVGSAESQFTEAQFTEAPIYGGIRWVARGPGAMVTGMYRSPRAAHQQSGRRNAWPAGSPNRLRLGGFTASPRDGCVGTAVLLHGFAARRLSVPADCPTQRPACGRRPLSHQEPNMRAGRQSQSGQKSSAVRWGASLIAHPLPGSRCLDANRLRPESSPETTVVEVASPSAHATQRVH